MTVRAAITWLVLAVLFVGAAAIVDRVANSTPVATQSERLARRELALADSITLVRPGVPELRIVRSAGRDEWMIRSPAGTMWPIESGRISALLRVLQGAEGVVAPSMVLPDPALDLMVSSGGQRLLSVAFDNERLAGMSLVRAQDDDGMRVMRIDDAVQRSMLGAGPLNWRDLRALPGLPADSSRIEVRTPAGTIELAKVAGVWALRAPVAARADSATVERTLRSLQSMQIGRFLDDSVEADERAIRESTRSAVIVEADRIDPVSGARSTDRWTIQIGGFAPEGSMFIARLARERQASLGAAAETMCGPVLGEIAQDALAQIPAGAEAYLSRTVLGLPASDIGSVRVHVSEQESRDFRRTSSGWTSTVAATNWGADEGDVPTTPADAAFLSGFVRALSDTRADRVTIVEPDALLEEWLTVTLASLGGQPVDTIRVNAVRGSGDDRLLVRAGSVQWDLACPPEIAAWLLAAAK